MAEGTSLPMSEWLRALHLEQYIENFERSDLWLVLDCRHLTDEALTQLGIHLPGHRKRILSGLQKAFTESLPAMECPELPPRRPVPMKRHIFRSDPGTAASPTQSDLGMAASEKSAAHREFDTLRLIPPPIPPRVGCQPPVKFSSPALLEFSPAPLPESPLLLDLSCPSLSGGRLSPEMVFSEGARKLSLPPLPAKRHQLPMKPVSLKAPPVPLRPPSLPPRATGPPKSTSSHLVKDEPQSLEAPAGIPPVLFPRVKVEEEHGAPDISSKLPCSFQTEFDDDSDYEDPPFEEEVDAPTEEMTDKGGVEITADGSTRHCLRFNSLLSEDELIEDYFKEESPPSNNHWNGCGLNSPCPGSAFPFGILSFHGDVMDEADASGHLSPVVKAGWLDKNPPQGSYIYQKRWVKLDCEHLRYFDTEKDIYSKRLIPVASITRVTSIGDQKFEVITNNRTFAFRAENDADRNEWIRVLQKTVDERKSKCLDRLSVVHLAGGSFDSVDKCGPLELRSFKQKLYVAVAGDKVFLYKNAEEFRLGIGITYIEMNVGNVKDVDRRGFDLTTPYRIFSFVAESDQEKEEWVEAMQNSIAEALSNFEVAERIWTVEENRFCADCGALKPDWGSINLCVVICKRCAGEHRGLGPSVTKVRSLKMDRKVWTEELIELFLQVGNAVANRFWAANVPPSEAITATSSSQERRRFLVAKYREGKYRRYHTLFGNQEELNKRRLPPTADERQARGTDLLPGLRQEGKLRSRRATRSLVSKKRRAPAHPAGRRRSTSAAANPSCFGQWSKGILLPCSIQRFSDENQMNTHNLAIVFGPTLFQTDGKDYKAGRVVEDLIRYYVDIFSVDEEEMRRQQEEIAAIMRMRIAGSSSGAQQAGDFICTVYLEEKKTEAEQHIKIPATMTAEELTFEILDRRKIITKEKDYWSCFEVSERDEAERPLHYSEKVLPIVHSLGKDSYLVVKRQVAMEHMLVYTASRVGDSKHGMMKFREEKNLLGLGLSTGFHDRYFILNNECLRLYKEVRSHKPEKEWPVKNLKVYLGIKKKVRPSTCWGFTVFFENDKQEKQQWYLCCETQQDQREWFASFLSIQHGANNLWPSETSKVRASRIQHDSRLGNISLIPLRGNESEMRNSVAAFTTDPLMLLRDL
ncbi:arf-GAP with Rho-GAP domain, ANK repeat and PH domain-containing protein 1-like [Heteronotia binoei]|uniref:arf-GAP with Rho-GAP domain, ANK repeat and PH domain-containing protein 1-like n=1 Tax=Heteronotia binoei TaxID=13085 RepID=UPI00292CF029|nr:arf-GAP with Rho-GAP domain, ANK repeat and PH domain-containing protein 1-like [Heteronotia binoei]